MNIKHAVSLVIVVSCSTISSNAATVMLPMASTPGIDQVQLVLNCESGPDPDRWHSAVATWVHPAWPSISGATWISSSYLIGEDGSPIAGDSWRWFRRSVEIPVNAEIVSGGLQLTADNAEEVWVNGILIGSDGEVCDPHQDNLEWSTIKTYDIGTALLPGSNEILVLVRNYPGSNFPTSNPTGLLYAGEISYKEAPDSDGDGITDAADPCPNSDLSVTVWIDGCDTGVANVLFSSGCTLADLIHACAANAENHGQFVSCVAHLTNRLLKDGVIAEKERGTIQRCAARASIP